MSEPEINTGDRDSDSRWFASDGPIPGWINAALVRTLIAVAGLVVVWWLARRLSSLLVIVFISIFLSFAIEPAVNSLEERGIRRGLGTGAVFLLVFGGFTIFGIAMGQVIADQINELVDEAPERITSVENWLQDNIDESIELEELQSTVSESGEFRSRATGFAGGLVGFGSAVIFALFDIFTIALFTFYLVAEGPKFRRTICSLLPPRYQKTVLEIWDIGTAKTGGYIASRVILVVISLVVHWVAFEVLGVRFALVLAIWVGLLSQFVPVIGTYVAAVLPVIIALADEPITAVWVVLFMVVFQQIENYLIAPRVTAQAMQVHPAVAFGSVLAGTAILGPVGALLALPVSATLQGFISTYASRYKVELEVENMGEGVAISTGAADSGNPAVVKAAADRPADDTVGRAAAEAPTDEAPADEPAADNGDAHDQNTDDTDLADLGGADPTDNDVAVAHTDRADPQSPSRLAKPERLDDNAAP